MEILETVKYLAEGNKKANNIACKIVGSSDYYEVVDKLKVLVNYNVRGDKLVKLFKYACKKDYAIFNLSIAMLKLENFSKEIVDKNLSLQNPIALVGSTVPKAFIRANYQELLADDKICSSFKLWAKKTAAIVKPKIEDLFSEQVSLQK